MSTENDSSFKVRPIGSSSEYEVIGINPNYPNRIIVRSIKGDLIGTVGKEAYQPLNTSWEEIEKKFLQPQQDPTNR